MIKKILAIFMMAITLFMCSACNNQKAPEIRTDKEPLLNRFTVLSDFKSCYWIYGDIGTSRLLPSPD